MKVLTELLLNVGICAWIITIGTLIGYILLNVLWKVASKIITIKLRGGVKETVRYIFNWIVMIIVVFGTLFYLVSMVYTAFHLFTWFT